MSGILQQRRRFLVRAGQGMVLLSAGGLAACGGSDDGEVGSADVGGDGAPGGGTPGAAVSPQRLQFAQHRHERERAFEHALQHRRGHGAVVVAAMPDPHTLLLVREYAAGVHRYELGLVKGRIDAGESPVAAANRELMEEAGYGAHRLDLLRSLTLAPTYMSHLTHLVLARELYPQRLPGDEPEPLELVPWKLADLGQLILQDDFSEGRSIAALFIAREWLQQHADD